MQQKSVFLGVALLAGILLVSMFLIERAATQASPSAVSAHPTPPPPIPPAQLGKLGLPTHVGGVPAIHHAGGGPITAADIQAFTAAHGFLGAARGRTDAGMIPVIVQIKLMTASQASTALKGEYVDRASTAQVWYVELQGPFTFTASEPLATGPFVAQKAIELFDATTGDLILFGTNG